MRLKAIVFSAIALTLIFTDHVFSSADISQQNKIVISIIDKEKNNNNLDKIKDIINQIDSVYGDLYNKLQNGGKIVIHFDPAHGRLNNGKWQGESTNRVSSTGITEELYSIPIARKLYNMLNNNKYIKIISNDEYMLVLKGESEEYKKIFFSETVKSAKAENAFMVISEHLNNISVLQKTDGIINIPGIHVTCDDAGNRYLTFIHSSYDGYLTLYNKYDISGMSKSIAYKMKEYIPSKGIKLNGWDYGAVADDRFSYFIDFPVSVIFESGFISNPVEEKKLRDTDYQQIIVDCQYRAILESIEKIFGVDVSGLWLKEANKNPEIVDLIKLSRISIYYLQNGYPEKAVNIINEIENNYSDSYSDLIEPYIILKDRIIKAEKYFSRCKYLQNAGKNKDAKRNLLNAVRTTGNEQIFLGLTDRYSKYARRNFGIRIIDWHEKGCSAKMPVAYTPHKASLDMPIILPVEKDQLLEDAVIKALSPRQGVYAKLVKAFNEAHIWKKIKKEKYSEKKKRNIVYWERERIKFTFKEGLYLVNLNRNFQITRVKKVSQLLLDPNRYQNHQYLKNSYFAGTTKEKSL
ncbi:MAG: N-acetylmuramoyl-L-alanine amidase [Spirochaetota bacterium]